MITQVKAASFVHECPVCKTQIDTLYSALTLGNDDSALFVPMKNCMTCNAKTCYGSHGQRIILAQLAVAEVLNLAKGVASYYSTWVAADVATALGDRPLLSDYETIPFTIGANGGRIHYASAMQEKSALQLLALALQGYQFYGTESERKGYIDALTASASYRSLLYKNNGVNV